MKIMLISVSIFFLFSSCYIRIDHTPGKNTKYESGLPVISIDETHPWEYNSNDDDISNSIIMDEMILKKMNEGFKIWQSKNIDVQLINNEEKLEYLEILKEKEFIEIDKQEAKDINAKIQNFDKYIITRALFTIIGGNYIIDYNNNNLFIYYYAYSNKKIETIYEDVLIIGLDSVPENIYITVGRTRTDCHYFCLSGAQNLVNSRNVMRNKNRDYNDKYLTNLI